MYIHVYKYICICTYLRIYRYTHVHVYVYIHTYMHHMLTQFSALALLNHRFIHVHVCVKRAC